MLLTIRSNQLAVLERERWQRMVLDMMAHLRAHFPAMAALPQWELGEEIEQSLARARGYGLTTPRDFARFLGLAASFGWSFDADTPWVREALSDPASGPSERLARVCDRCVRQLEQRAKAAALKGRLEG